jgi:LysM repeat protein
MLHRNTLIALCAIFCAVAVGAGLFVADMNKQSGLITQQPGLSDASQPPTAAAAQPTPEADTPTAAPEPTPTSATVAAIEPVEPSATSQPAPTSAPAATSSASSSTAAAYIEYTVQKGDLLNNIAKKYNVTTKEILAINDIPNADSLTVGQVIRIPKV